MKNKCEELYSLLDSVQEANEYLKEHEESLFLLEDISEAIHAINSNLYNASCILNNRIFSVINEVLNKKTDLTEYYLNCGEWIKLAQDTLDRRKNLKTKTDLEFYQLTDYIKYNDYEVLLEHAVSNIKEIYSKDRKLSYEYEGFYAVYRNFFGGMLIEKNYFKVLENRVGELKEHLADFEWLYEQLGDYRSKQVLSGILKNWLTFDHKLLDCIKENNYPSYFDLDLIKCDENEVFVDLGAYTGDSALSFINTYGAYKKIYCYEITPESILKIQHNLAEHQNIEILNKGVGKEEGSCFLKRIGKTGAANQTGESGELEIKIVSLDKDIQEKITFIKMDIEGAEQDALYGCERHIKEERPKLAVCTYHNNTDIWKIPRIIKEMEPTYNLYMRYNGTQIGPMDFVLFAV